MLLTIKIAVGADVFELAGEVPFTDVLTLVSLWFVAIDPPDLQSKLDTFVARGVAANDLLNKVVAATTPTP